MGENRNIDDGGRDRDRKDAPRGYHTWRPDNIEHDAPPSIFYPRSTTGYATVGERRCLAALKPVNMRSGIG